MRSVNKGVGMFRLLWLSALLLPFAATAQDLGSFASEGYVGIKANTLTFVQAQGACLNELGVGSAPIARSIPIFDNSFKRCMRDYVPFTSADAASGNSCASQTVTWGQCSGLVNVLETGNTAFVKNTNDISNLTGFANFMCGNGQLIYMSGGCARTTDACEAGLVSQWPVTFPAWADGDVNTEYRDKYGVLRNKPQANCAATMQEAKSGDFIVQNVTPDVVDFSRYASSSRAPLRCFNGEYNLEPPESAVCEVVPRGCNARVVNYNGCSFNIPATGHDEVFSSKNPNPILSVGHVEAYCFDGDLEIKSQSCALSCDGNPKSTVWSPETDVGRSCSHPDINGRQRIPPGATQLVENVEFGMKGSITRQCVSGVMVETGQSCAPEPCSSIPARTWNDPVTGLECSHLAQEIPFGHDGGTVTVPANDFFGVNGEAEYSCRFGEARIESTSCFKIGEVGCNAPGIGVPPTPTPMPGGGLDFCEVNFNRSGMVRVGNTCCTGSAGRGNLTCYQIP